MFISENKLQISIFSLTSHFRVLVIRALRLECGTEWLLKALLREAIQWVYAYIILFKTVWNLNMNMALSNQEEHIWTKENPFKPFYSEWLDVTYEWLTHLPLRILLKKMLWSYSSHFLVTVCLELELELTTKPFKT